MSKLETQLPSHLYNFRWPFPTPFAIMKTKRPKRLAKLHNFWCERLIRTLFQTCRIRSPFSALTGRIWVDGRFFIWPYARPPLPIPSHTSLNENIEETETRKQNCGWQCRWSSGHNRPRFQVRGSSGGNVRGLGRDRGTIRWWMTRWRRRVDWADLRG